MAVQAKRSQGRNDEAITSTSLGFRHLPRLGRHDTPLNERAWALFSGGHDSTATAGPLPALRDLRMLADPRGIP